MAHPIAPVQAQNVGALSRQKDTGNLINRLVTWVREGDYKVAKLVLVILVSLIIPVLLIAVPFFVAEWKRQVTAEQAAKALSQRLPVPRAPVSPPLPARREAPAAPSQGVPPSLVQDPVFEGQSLAELRDWKLSERIPVPQYSLPETYRFQVEGIDYRIGTIMGGIVIQTATDWLGEERNRGIFIPDFKDRPIVVYEDVTANPARWKGVLRHLRPTVNRNVDFHLDFSGLDAAYRSGPRQLSQWLQDRFHSFIKFENGERYLGQANSVGELGRAPIEFQFAQTAEEMSWQTTVAKTMFAQARTACGDHGEIQFVTTRGDVRVGYWCDFERRDLHSKFPSLDPSVFYYAHSEGVEGDIPASSRADGYLHLWSAASQANCSEAVARLTPRPGLAMNLSAGDNTQGPKAQRTNPRLFELVNAFLANLGYCEFAAVLGASKWNVMGAMQHGHLTPENEEQLRLLVEAFKENWPLVEQPRMESLPDGGRNPIYLMLGSAVDAGEGLPVECRGDRLLHELQYYVALANFVLQFQEAVSLANKYKDKTVVCHPTAIGLGALRSDSQVAAFAFNTAARYFTDELKKARVYVQVEVPHADQPDPNVQWFVDALELQLRSRMGERV